MCVIRSVLEPEAYALPSRRTWAQHLFPKINVLHTCKRPMLDVTDVEPVPPNRTEFLQSTVRGILLTMPPRVSYNEWQHLNRILLLNPSIFELSIRHFTSPAPDPLQPLPPQMRPTRLTLEFSYDKGGVIIDLRAPLFTSVTHLTLLDISSYAKHPETWAQWEALPALPALTHLCVTPEIARAIVPQVLTACPHFEAFIVLWLSLLVPYRSKMPPGLAAPAYIRFQMEAFADTVHAAPDARLVLVFESNFDDAWERGVKSGYDMWVRVREFIARKRRGEIEGRSFFL